jgi:hypothetical protein
VQISSLLPRKFLVFCHVLLELGVVVENEVSQSLEALVALRESMVFIVPMVILAFVLLLLYILGLSLFPTPFAFAVNAVEAALHGLDHLADFLPVVTEQLVLLKFFLGDEVKTIVAAHCKFVNDLGLVFAAVEVEDELLLGESVGVVERTDSLIVVLALPKHVR